MTPITLATAPIADACARLGRPLRVAPAGLMPVVPGVTIHGRVRPAAHAGSVDVFFEAIGSATPGDVLVIDNDGRLDEGCIGDLVVLETKMAGLSGIVLWGTHRDTTELQRLALPVFSYGTMPNGPASVRPRHPDALTRVRCGGVQVTVGDWVVADDDGAVFVRGADWPEVEQEAIVIIERERQQSQIAQAGQSLRAQFGFEEFLARREADPVYTLREHLRQRGAEVEQ